MRRLAARAFLPLLLAGCAHIEAPTGGPEDKTPPKLLTTRPDTLGRISAGGPPVVLVFDEPLSEQRVEESVLVSPRTSAPEVDKRGDEIRVSLRRGWEAGRIYQVTVLPQVQDLFNNRITAPIHLVFSTGPEIPDTRMGGTVVDRLTGRGEAGTRVEAVLAPDTLPYVALTDSAGGFTFRRIPQGTYRVRAYRDANTSGTLDAYEARDTATLPVAVGREATVRLRTLQPDSTPPAAASAQVQDSLVEVRFDDPLDPAQRLTPAQVTLLLPDSTPVAVAEVRMGRADGASTAPADTT
ncbi:MAG: Ig-like domain-containing protein, partial [Gemmatimonadota bacterium]|nr:Ig-like domain-containing protein [Gemmatimonadota bacterium]